MIRSFGDKETERVFRREFKHRNYRNNGNHWNNGNYWYYWNNRYHWDNWNYRHNWNDRYYRWHPSSSTLIRHVASHPPGGG